MPRVTKKIAKVARDENIKLSAIILISVFALLVIKHFVVVQKEEVKVKKISGSVEVRKSKFKKLLVLPVTKVYIRLEERYQEVAVDLKKSSRPPYIKKLKKEYGVIKDDALLRALKPHPISLTLAQAALESSWGTSRFFAQANNVFGMWSFNKNEPRIAAGQKRSGKTIWLKKYSSIEESIEDYYELLGKGGAFKKFRKAKMKTDDSLVLATKLDKYSEKGPEYGKALISIIKYNNFKEYDL